MQGNSEKNVLKITGNQAQWTADAIVVEAPLEIQIWDAVLEKYTPLLITMRTPGQDIALSLGLLYTEGLISRPDDVLVSKQVDEQLVRMMVDPKVLPRLDDRNRRFYSTASCGVCGKTSLDKLQYHSCHFPARNSPKVPIGTLQDLPQQLQFAQALFHQTGGNHAAALFQPDGELIELQEDVGRHNALDKLIGHALLQGRTPWRNNILVLSGRISFELVQKASMLGVPILLAVGAPSSLAIELADECGITLMGFVRSDRCNIYSQPQRVVLSKEQERSTPLATSGPIHQE